MRMRSLGIDVASSTWGNNGSALVEFDVSANIVSRVVPGAISWPEDPLSPHALARAIDEYAQSNGVRAIALDGPQGWRDPSTDPGLPGVGRRCEYESRTQGKTGIYPTTYPGNQRSWIEFSIELFDELLRIGNASLADSLPSSQAPSSKYYLLECFPTSTWRTSRLKPLPKKSSKPGLQAYVRALGAAYGLPSFQTQSHDDLQAVVAGLAAMAVCGGPAVAVPRGVPSRLHVHQDGASRRIEGVIWDASPASRHPRVPSTVVEPNAPLPASEQEAVSKSSDPQNRAVLYVTPKVVRRANDRQDLKEAQIAQSGIPWAKGDGGRRIRLVIEEAELVLVLGDTHAFWRKHQVPDTLESFDGLFASLSDSPGTKQRAEFKDMGPA